MRNRWGVVAKRWATAVLVAGLGLAGSASATLISRGADLVYDDVLNVTWTRNANLSGSSNLTFAQANAWAANLVFAGYADWRLPTIGSTTPTTFATETNCALVTAAVCAASGNELGYMFHVNLGGIFGNNKTGTQTAVGGEVLSGIQPFYWSGTELTPGISGWGFVFGIGRQDAIREFSPASAWAVRSGDVITVVPEPRTVTLMLFGLGLLGWRTKRR